MAELRCKVRHKVLRHREDCLRDSDWVLAGRPLDRHRKTDSLAKFGAGAGPQVLIGKESSFDVSREQGAAHRECQ